MLELVRSFLTKCHYPKMFDPIFLVACLLLAPWRQSWGCDICTVYNSILSSRGSQNSLNIGISQQFTSFSSSIGGQKQTLDSSITQPFLNYYVTDELSFQVNFPLIDRRARRLAEERIEYKQLGGIGDIPVLFKYQASSNFDSGASLIWEFFGGVELPTGSTSELQEDAHEEEEELIDMPEMPDQRFARHGEEQRGGSLVDGHDLALGSGSFDWIGGTSLFYVKGRNYFNSLLQYTIRQEGDFGFRYGDDFQWQVGPGRYLSFEHDQTIGIRARISGEVKQADVLAGTTIADSGLFRVFVGPELMATLGNTTFLSLGTDFLVSSNSAREGVLPHARFLAVLSHRF